MTATEWQVAEKKVDPEFAGSVFETLGFDAQLCPACNAHLKSGICLNACHLGDEAKQRFNNFMAKFVGVNHITDLVTK